MAAAPDLGSGAFGRRGSTPLSRTRVVHQPYSTVTGSPTVIVPRLSGIR